MNIIYCGIDLHKENLMIGVLKNSDSSQKIETFNLRNEEKSISQFFKKLQKENEVRACYEAGPCGYTLYRQLKTLGINCEVIAPSLIPKKSGDKIKTDRRDAIKLTELYKNGLLTPIRIPNENEETVKSLIKMHEQYTVKIIRIKNQIGKFLLFKGRQYMLGNKWTKEYMDWLDKTAKNFEDTNKYILTNYINELIYFQTSLEDVDNKVEEFSNQVEYVEKVNILKCFRGIETYTAMALLTNVVDFRRFQRAEQFMSYIGLTPREKSSGDYIQKGTITKAGNKLLRKLLIEGCKNYRYPAKISKTLQKRLEKSTPTAKLRGIIALKRLHKVYYNLLYTKGANIAAVATARELCGFIWAAMNDKPLVNQDKIIMN